MSQETSMDRRLETKSVSYERRLDERVGILENRMDTVDKKFDKNQELLFKFFDRFDSHIQNESEADIRIHVALTHVADGLESTNNTLVEIRDQSALTTKHMDQVHTIWRTIVIIISISCTLLGGAFTIYQYEQKQITELSK